MEVVRSTGVPELDAILQGYPPGGVLIEGYKEDNVHFLASFVRAQREPMVLIFTQTDPLLFFKLAGLGAQDLDRLRVIDAYSWKKGRTKRYKNFYPLYTLSDLNKLVIRTHQVSAELGFSVPYVLDTLSQISVYAPMQDLYEFLQWITYKTKPEGLFLTSLDKRVHEKKEVALLEYHMDVILELARKEGEKYLRIKKFPGAHFRGWAKYETSPSGIKLLL